MYLVCLTLDCIEISISFHRTRYIFTIFSNIIIIVVYIHLCSDIFLAQYSIFLGGFLKLSRKHITVGRLSK